MNTNMNTTRPTPETDAVAWVVAFGYQHLNEDVDVVGAEFARQLERERDEAREELQQWKMLCAWGGTPEHIDQFIKGQQSRIHQAQDIEETCEQLERERDEARRNAEVERLSGVAVVAMCKRQESEIEAMREAIEDVNKILLSIQRNDIFEETMRNHATCALAKLQPFIKP